MVARQLPEVEVAERLGLAPQTLTNWRSLGKGPPWRKVGGRVRYDEQQLERWLKADGRAPNRGRTHRATSTS